MFYKVSNSNEGTGTITITTNGVHDVKKYASANVNVNRTPSYADYTFSWQNFKGEKTQSFTVPGHTIVGAGIIAMETSTYNGVDMRYALHISSYNDSSSATVRVSNDGSWSHTEVNVSGTLRVYYI
jgi:hypothetical protein